MIIVNSPHNPTGAVFTFEALTEIVRLANQRDAIIVTDEVYEHLVYDDRHVPIASIEDAAHRTVSISSAGKTFSVTGWKIGWITASPARIAQIGTVKQYLTFVGGVPLQPAIAVGLRQDEEHFDTMLQTYARKRDLLAAGLRRAGFKVHPAPAGYFLLADASALGYADAAELARKLPELCGVVGVPLSALARPSRHDLKPLIRFAFCKSDDTIARASERLANLGS